MFLLSGCGGKSVAYSFIEQDAYHTGGNITFVYDHISHTAYFGDKGEFIEYYDEDIAKGWREEGNRIGFKIALPQNVDDYMSATAIIDGKEMSYDQFIVGEEVKYALFQPIVNKETSLLIIKIRWESSAKEQIYNIVIREGTGFINK